VGGFDERFWVAEDTEYFHRLAFVSPVVIVMNPLVGYRVGLAGSLIASTNVTEVIHNALKHSQASALDLFIKNENNSLVVEIADNGSGFEYHSISKTGSGLGLKNIVSRVELLKGDLYIETKPGEGTRYRITIPL